MLSKKPCIILSTCVGFTAINEDGRLIAARMEWNNLANEVANLDYKVVSNNSRLGKTILDKLNTHIV